MDASIPDLWRVNEDAVRLYSLYLCRLQMNHRHERVVAVCPQIRRFAVRGPGAREGLVTFPVEMDSLCALKDYKKAWRRLRHRERIIFGKPLDLRRRRWLRTDASQLAFYYAPLLYFLGRYREGCRLLETALGFPFRGGKPRSFDIRFHVCNDDEEPWHRCRVTLSHFYRKLHRDLRDWRHWKAFVNGFHPRLFRLAATRPEELLSDPARLSEFLNRLVQVRNERTTSGAGGSVSDLIESASKVKKRQDSTQKKLDDFRRRIRPVQEQMDCKLKELFPELQQLGQQPMAH